MGFILLCYDCFGIKWVVQDLWCNIGIDGKGLGILENSIAHLCDLIGFREGFLYPINSHSYEKKFPLIAIFVWWALSFLFASFEGRRIAENGRSVSPSHFRSVLIRSLSCLMREIGKLENARELVWKGAGRTEAAEMESESWRCWLTKFFLGSAEWNMRFVYKDLELNLCFL